MKLKAGVRIGGIRPEAVVGMMLVDSVYQEIGFELTVTSIGEGKHKTRSDHYDGRAFDCRTRFFTDKQKESVVDSVKSALGDDFIVILESTHMHISWRPLR